ncbi:hypothetical protein BOW53_15200 [Solemya pervernicosa gill symbiont]|uniref:DUF6531 domain-containing protein n=1 Tax=Solemya pervernicosa gill symbiont TaxID=642797 RepID=A0A1T2L0A2_9GAMM|nr:DUF6531 domain-containing protein [Solemya pervernicosa gill symbiont]OOZ38529.1 hypothetical protein BOW53_15200 [Solemya pervernicosa gill symbiont]
MGGLPYDLKLLSDGPQTGRFGTVRLTGQCGGGNWILGAPVSCRAGEAVTGHVAELNDGCFEGCAVGNLRTEIDGKWISTLQGEFTGEACEDSVQNNGVNTDKMLACGTVGSGSYSTKIGNPIDFAIGNKYFHASDYKGNGEFPIVFDRSYSSLVLGWRYAYTQRIERLADDLMVVRRPGGQSYEFRLSGGQWLSDPDVTDRLETVTDTNGLLSGWRYILSNKKQENFDTQGRLLSIRNASGESLFLRKLVLGIQAQASGKYLTRPFMPTAPRRVRKTLLRSQFPILSECRFREDRYVFVDCG